MWPNHRKALYDIGITICLYFGMNKLHKKILKYKYCNIIMASPRSNTMFIVSIAINTVEYVLQSWLCCCSFYKYII